ncbi:MAG: DUF763 domain-containing protein [Pseudomonadota bacterium]
MRTGVVNLPLHYGKAPSWLFKRMAALVREIVMLMVMELGRKAVLEKLSDPAWFQALGCIVGFDWHSSGLTTTVCGALKEGVKGVEKELGLFVAGGKGKTSRQTPHEIERVGSLLTTNPEHLKYASRMSAKVDSSGLQDGYQIYHHTFVFTREGTWAVIQQGMNEVSGFARRYHWLSEGLEDFVCEPHQAICTDKKAENALNLVAKESEGTRNVTASLAREYPEKLVHELNHLKTLELPSRHHIALNDINPERLYTIFCHTYDAQPENFECLLGLPGVGPKTIRALSLVSELVYGVPPSYRDPARFSFAHGGKDGHPYPVDRITYDKSIDILRQAVSRAKIGEKDKLAAIKRLLRFIPE